MFTHFVKRGTASPLSFFMLNNQLKLDILFSTGNCKRVIRATESAKLIYKEHVNGSSARDEEKIIRMLDPSIPKSLALNGVFLPLYYGQSAEDYRRVSFYVETEREKSQLTHLQILLSTAYALEDLHGKGILHRDLKLKNIIVCPRLHIVQNSLQWHANIIDYESANFINALKQDTVITDLGYVAPEVLKKEGVGFASDIYSLGICFLRLFYQGAFSNKRIHQGDFSQFNVNFNAYGFSDDEQRQLEDLLYGMLSNDAKSRPNLAEVISCFSNIYSQHSDLPYQQSERVSIGSEAKLLAIKEEALLGMKQSGCRFDDFVLFKENFAQLQKECQEHIPYQPLGYR